MKLFRDYAVLSSGQVAGRLLGLLAFAWLGRVLDPAAYGGVEYVIGIVLLGGSLIDGASGLVGVRLAAQERTRLPTLAFQILVVRLIFAAISVPILAALGLWTVGPSVPKALVWLFTLSLALAPWRQEWTFQAAGLTAPVAWAQTIRAGAFAVLAWTLVRGPDDVVDVGWAEIGSVAALTAYCILVQHARITPFRLTGSLDGFSSLLKESAAAGASNLLWAATQYAPLLMIGALVGGVQTGWFAAATRVVGALMVIPYVYHFGIYPAVARAAHRRDELQALLTRSCRVAAWGGILLALALTLWAQPLMVLAMGSKLEGSAPMLQVMAWMLPVSLCAGHAQAALAADGAQLQLLWTRVAALGTVVAVGLALGPTLEGEGYALAAVAGTIAFWVIAHACAARRGLHPPGFALAWKPAALALSILVAAHLTGAGAWLSLGWLAVYFVGASMLDRRLARDFADLGRISLGASTARGL